MEGEPKKELRHIEFAKKVAQELLNDYSPSEQREFIEISTSFIKQNYTNQMDSLEKEREVVKEKLSIFNGETPKPGISEIS